MKSRTLILGMLLLVASLMVLACERESPTTPELAAAEPGAMSAAVGSSTSGVRGGQPKIDICHQEGNGSYHPITVAEAAVPAHMGHGDWQVQDEVPDGIDNDCDGEVDEQLETVTFSYYYSFGDLSGTASVLPGEVFTIWNEIGGCGPVFRDIAECHTNPPGQIRALIHDCLTGDGPGTFGPWVSTGCSTAEEFGFVVECCLL